MPDRRGSARRRTNDKKVTRRSLQGSYHLAAAPTGHSLLSGMDCGPALVVDSRPFASGGREPGWGSSLDPFLAQNSESLKRLGISHRVVPGRDGVRLELQPGLRVGAIPLKSPLTGRVAGGVVIRPRFGWPGVGRVLSEIGWGSAPEFLELPLVPGSGREVPPWIVAGPVLQRLSRLLANLRRGYRDRTEVRTSPRGQIQWGSYASSQLPKGRWHHLPCRFSELESDNRLRQAIRWTLERIQRDLNGAGSADGTVVSLLQQLNLLMEHVRDVSPRRPSKSEIELSETQSGIDGESLREGLRAMGWISDERGLGGGKTLDGLAWTLPLDSLWERYVERIVRSEAASTGGMVKVGRLGETTVPLAWNDRSHRALGHLAPDVVVRRGDAIEIVDAKYKSHFADLDAERWHELHEEVQQSMRADIHQVLAYAAACGTSNDVSASLIYPVRREMFERLSEQKRHISSAVIPVGMRTVSLNIRAIPFGMG